MSNVTKIQILNFDADIFLKNEENEMLNNSEIDNIQIEILFLETTGAKSVEISIIPLLWPKRSLYQEFFSSFKMWRKKNPLN